MRRIIDSGSSAPPFSISAAVGFVALGMGVATAIEPFAAFLARFKKHLAKVEHAMGALLVLTGIAFLTGSINQMSIWILEMFPVLGRIG